MAVESSEEQATLPLQLIALDQTLICFDVEQPRDARQDLVVARTVAENKTVAWRIRTNAPTRYCVCPNSGVLDSCTAMVSVVVELVANRYNPNHKLIVQAIELMPGESPKTIWKSERARSATENVQTVNLELSTTLMNLDHTQHLSNANDKSVHRTASLTSILEQSSTIGEERVKELEALSAMLQDDIQQMQKNVDQTIRLKETLEKALQSRNDMKLELKAKIADAETKEKAAQKKLDALATELQQCNARKQMQADQCVIS